MSNSFDQTWQWACLLRVSSDFWCNKGTPRYNYSSSQSIYSECLKVDEFRSKFILTMTGGHPPKSHRLVSTYLRYRNLDEIRREACYSVRPHSPSQLFWFIKTKSFSYYGKKRLLVFLPFSINRWPNGCRPIFVRFLFGYKPILNTAPGKRWVMHFQVSLSSGGIHR